MTSKFLSTRHQHKVLSSDSKYIVDVFMWAKFGNCSISMTKVVTTSSLLGFYQENRFFEGWSCFKFNNLGLALGTNLKFYVSEAKGLKLKVRKFWGLIPSFVEVTRKKLVESSFLPHLPPFLPFLVNRVNISIRKKWKCFFLFHDWLPLEFKYSDTIFLWCDEK